MTTTDSRDHAAPREAVVTVATFGSLGEAGVARGVLESAGIDSRLADEATIGLAWHLGNALGGLRLQVAAGDAATAEALLSTELPATAAAPSSTPRDRTARRAMAAALLGLGVLPIVAHVYALFLLARLGKQPGPLSRTGRRHAVVAAVASGLVLASAAALAGTLAVW